MKSSSSEESVRKRSHSIGANSIAPSTLSVMTTTNICDIDDAVIEKQDIVGKFKPIFHLLYMCVNKYMKFYFVNRWHKEVCLSR